MRFQGKTAMVTGGTKVFGRAFATTLADGGCRTRRSGTSSQRPMAKG